MAEPLKVAKTTPASKLAGSIAYGIREEGQVTVSAIGATAQRIAEQAIEMAKRFLSEEGHIVMHERTDEQVSRQAENGETVTATLARYNLRAEKQEEATKQR